MSAQQPTLFGPPVFGRDRLPKREAESAPAWPSLATVQKRRDLWWNRMQHPGKWEGPK